MNVCLHLDVLLWTRDRSGSSVDLMVHVRLGKEKRSETVQLDGSCQ